MRRIFIAGLLLLAAGASRAEAQQAVPETAYQSVNEALVAHHVLPRYQRLAEATTAFAEGAASFCAAPAAAGLETLRAGFGAAMEAWMGVEHLRFGPVELFMRAPRLYFWPQARGKVDAAVRDLIATGDRDLLAPERFRDASVAVQGLPAAEVLLFDEADALFVAGGPHCALLQAIAVNLRAIAGDVLAAWRDGYGAKMTEPGGEGSPYPTAKDATLAFFKSFYNGLELIAAAKLKPVAGDSAKAAKPQLAEARRSGRSLRNIVVDLEALQALYEGKGDAGLGVLARDSTADPKLDPLMQKAFRLTLETARGIEGPLGEAAADPARRGQVDKLVTQVSALKQIVKTRLAAALDLGVGFNALDGD